MKTTALLVALTSFAIGAASVLASLAAVAQPKPDSARASILSGVYTAAQNERGEAVHESACALCHGERLNGAGQADMPPSPAIAGLTFLHKWAGQPLASLFVYVKTKMPLGTPGSLSDQESIDAVAHMLAVSGMPAGDKDLPPDPTALANIVIELPPKNRK